MMTTAGTPPVTSTVRAAYQRAPQTLNQEKSTRRANAPIGQCRPSGNAFRCRGEAAAHLQRPVDHTDRCTSDEDGGPRQPPAQSTRLGVAARG